MQDLVAAIAHADEADPHALIGARNARDSQCSRCPGNDHGLGEITSGPGIHRKCVELRLSCPRKAVPSKSDTPPELFANRDLGATPLPASRKNSILEADDTPILKITIAIRPRCLRMGSSGWRPASYRDRAA
jgi:hypothetical protein